MIDPGRVLNEFYCVEARCDFDLYRSMFENDPKKTTLCVDYAPYFFNDFGRILTRFLVLHVCRLTDPAGSGSKSNLTTNYILGNLAWPTAVQVNLRQYNDQLMVFRAKVEPARSKRIAHTDLHSQMNRLGAIGTFTKGEDAKFFADLQSLTWLIATSLLPPRRQLPLAVRRMHAHKVIRAMKKRCFTIAATNARRSSEPMMFSISRAFADTHPVCDSGCTPEDS